MARLKRYKQKQLIKTLKQHGWEQSVGGKHQVKMIREGHRPVTIPEFKGETLPVGLSQAILKQAGIEDDS
ncbi:MAG: addiction module toxin, HicA family [Actinobacteria bacterium]|nr:addiction module toxin, HicA family [Actinomycetota bacterium]